jgi:transcriptional regulator with XRE-family HTH domain
MMKGRIPMNFNEILQKLRHAHQLSKEELAERLHLSRQAVAKWEAGQTLPEILS